MSASLFTDDNTPAFGLYTGEILDLPLDAYQAVSPFLRRYRAKKWRFVGLFSRRLALGLAVVEAGYVGTAFGYAFDMKSRHMREFKATSPLARACRISDHAGSGSAVYEGGGNSIRLTYGLPAEESLVEASLQTSEGPLEIQARFSTNREAVIPHQVILPTPGGRFHFTHKTAGMPCRATVRMNGETIELSEKECAASEDHSAGYPDYHWQWRWAALGGRTAEGVRVGLNLADPVYHPEWTENVIWIDGERYPVGRAEFAFDRRRILEPWSIRTDDGAVDLEFKPLGERKETLNAGLILSRFHQPVGLFSGVFRPDGTTEVRLEDVPGVCEDHQARW